MSQESRDNSWIRLVTKGIYPKLLLYLISEMSNNRLILEPMNIKEANVITGPVLIRKEY